MMLLKTTAPRKGHHDLMLGSITAINAGLVNVCSVMAFFAFSTNITGHVAIFAEEISKGHWYQVSVVVGWMLAFLFGAFFATLAAVALPPHRRWLGQSVAHLLQIFLLAAVAHYGRWHYKETLFESEALVGMLLFTMGLQNGGVAHASDGMVKTTHLTGLFTDLGGEIAMLTRARHRADRAVRFKFVLHVLILAGYIVGGLLGGYLYLRVGFSALYVGCALLGLVLMHDLGALAFSRLPARPMKLGVSRELGLGRSSEPGPDA